MNGTIQIWDVIDKPVYDLETVSLIMKKVNADEGETTLEQSRSTPGVVPVRSSPFALPAAAAGTAEEAATSQRK